MPNFTTNLRLILPITGEYSGTWGDTVNTSITNLVDSAIAGYSSVAMTDANYTLTSANGTADQARSMMLNITGALTANRDVICPAGVTKLYSIKNATTGGFAITLKYSTGTGISIPNGRTMVLMCDGTNVREAIDYSVTGNFTNISYTGTLTGGTGIVNLGSGQVYKDASGNVGIGAVPTVAKVQIYDTAMGDGVGTSAYMLQTGGVVPSNVTTTAFGVTSSIGTTASAFNLGSIQHFTATQTSLGAGSTVTSQYGFYAAGSLSGAVNNYGFYGTINSSVRDISFVSLTSNVATITTATAHGLSVGSQVLVEAAINTSLNGIYTVIATPLTTTFTYARAIPDITLTADAGTVSNNGLWNLYLPGTAPNYFAGNVGFNTLVPQTELSMADGGILSWGATNYVRITATSGDGSIYFGTRDAEYARFNGSGNMCIGGVPATSAILDVQSTTKGFRLPNMTTTQKNLVSSPVAGLMVFDTTLGKACLYTGSAWQTITSV